jgi:integrase
LVIVFDRLGRRTGVKHVDADRIRQTFSTWAIENRLRKLKGQSLLGHSTSMMVRRCPATYDSAKAVAAHQSFRPVARLVDD